MFKLFKSLLLLCLCLVAALFLIVAGQGDAPAYAASLTPHRPLPGGCPNASQRAYGVSYDADTASPAVSSIFGEAFSFTQTSKWTPDIAAYTENCNDGTYISSYVALLFNNASATSFDVLTTVDGQTTRATYPGSYQWYYNDEPDNHRSFVLNIALHKRYTFQIKACYDGFGCSDWSPQVTVVSYENIFCQNGYVFREANPYDQVCVTPDQRTQAAVDNSLADSRVDPNGASGPKSCISGYVWRWAFGGDYVCVTPDERTQVGSDNSQSDARVVAQ